MKRTVTMKVQRKKPRYNINTEEEYKDFIEKYKSYQDFDRLDDNLIISLIEFGIFQFNSRLILGHTNKITNNLFRFFSTSNKLTNIKDLSLINIPITTKSLILLAKSQMRVETLAIIQCSLIEDEGFEKYFASPAISSLKTLCLIEIEDFSSKSLNALLNNQKYNINLKKLELRWCSNIDNEALCNLFDNNFKLESLWLSGIKFSDEFLNSISSRFDLSLLQNLSLTSNQSATESGFKQILNSENLKNLKILTLDNLKGFSGEALECILNPFPKLNTFNLCRNSLVNDDNLTKLSERGFFETVENFKLSNCSQIGNAALNAIFDNPINKSFKIVRIHNLPTPDDSGFEKIFSYNTNALEIIEFAECTDFKNISFDQTKLNALKLDELKRLEIAECTQLGNGFFQNLKYVSFPNLEYFRLSNNSVINEIGFSNLSKHKKMPKLKEICISNCSNFNNRGFEELVKSQLAKNLEKLSCYNCELLNDEIASHFAHSNLEKIKELHLAGINLTQDAVETIILSDFMKNVEVIDFKNANFVFPSFFKSKNIRNLRRIEGNMEGISKDTLINLFKFSDVHQDFQFSEIMGIIPIDEDIIKAATNSKLQTQILYLPLNDIGAISIESLIGFISSKNLHVFFDIEGMINQCKTIFNDSLLKAITENEKCMLNLLSLDLSGAKEISEEAISNFLISKNLSKSFKFNDFITKSQSKLKGKVGLIIQGIRKGNFVNDIEELDFSEYQITNQNLSDILSSNLDSLRHLILSNTAITNDAIDVILNWKQLGNLTYLSMSSHKAIEVWKWEEFFGNISSQFMSFKHLDFEFNNLNNECIKLLSEAGWIKNVVKLGISGCTLIDYDGIIIILKICEIHKTLRISNIFEDFRQYFVYSTEQGGYIPVKDNNVNLEEVIDFILNPEKIRMNSSQKKRKISEVRDNVIKALTENEKLRDALKIDLNSAGITSDSCIYIANSNKCLNLNELIFDNTLIDDRGISFLAGSKFLKNVGIISVNNCNYLTGLSISYVIQSDFSNKFCLDSFITQLAGFLNSESLKQIESSKYILNSKEFDLANYNSLSISDLQILLAIEKKVPHLNLRLNLGDFIDQNVSSITDLVLEEISQSRFIEKYQRINLLGIYCSKKALEKFILSPQLNKNFDIQNIISSHSSLIDDQMLNSISRARFYNNLTEIDLKDCPNVTILGLQSIVRSHNPNFQIQKIINENFYSINFHFIQTISNQDYFKELKSLDLSKCPKIGSKELITCIENFGINFDIESIINPENLPGGKTDLITNEVILSIAKSKPFQYKFISQNSRDPKERRYFEFNIRRYQNVDYGLNYFIGTNTASPYNYDDYLQHYTSILHPSSLQNIIILCQSNIPHVISQMEGVSRLDFSQNKFLYNKSFKNHLIDGFDQFQTLNFMGLSRDTIGIFCEKIIKIEGELGYSRLTEDEIDQTLVYLLHFLPNLEELNLSNQNIGDTFIKGFSILMDKRRNNLKKLRSIRLMNNPRFSAIGLKYLYVSLLRHKNIEEIDISCYEEDDSGFTFFTNNGVYGLMNHLSKRLLTKYQDSYRRKKSKFFPFLFDFQTLKLTIFSILVSGPFIYHLKEVIMKKLNTFIQRLVNFFIVRKFFPPKNHEEEFVPGFLYPLVSRYKSVMNAIQESREYVHTEGKILFYFDESFYVLNNCMAGPKKKRQLTISEQPQIEYDSIISTYAPSSKAQIFDTTSYFDYEPKYSYQISKVLNYLKWILMVNIFMYYGVVFGSLIAFRKSFESCELSTVNQVMIQVPFLIYLVFSFILEYILVHRVARIISNKEIVNWKSFSTFTSILNSQISKYDFFTDINFILQNYWCDNKGVFIASTIIMSIFILINLIRIKKFVKKNFFQKNFDFHSTKYINIYSKFCLVQELYGIGIILDKFSTSSAIKFNGWFVPKVIENKYIPLIIISTVQRVLVEDVPQLIVQLIALSRPGTNLNNFSTLSTLLATITNLNQTLHTVWNVKPSYFSRNLFNIYWKEINSQNEEKGESKKSDLEGSNLTSTNKESEILDYSTFEVNAIDEYQEDVVEEEEEKK